MLFFDQIFKKKRTGKKEDTSNKKDEEGANIGEGTTGAETAME